MYKNRYEDIVNSGNGRWLEEPVHMDVDGNIVEDESEAFGWEVTMVYTRPHNVFFFDETGGNTCEKDDGNNGGEMMIVPVGEVPRQSASTKDNHFTVVPVSTAAADLVLVCIIFKGERLHALDAMGLDIFVPWKEGGFMANVGPGTRHPGGPTIQYRGKEIPCLCAATTNSSMNGTVLKQLVQTLDELGVTERGEGVWPCFIIDGHISRMSEEFLSYTTAPETKCEAGLGTVYGSLKWQPHDDERMNGGFENGMVEAKSRLTRKKRLHGLKPPGLGDLLDKAQQHKWQQQSPN